MSGRKSCSSLAIREGLLVTPERTPQRTPSRISSRLAVSRNNFMRTPFFVLQRRFSDRLHCALEKSFVPLGNRSPLLYDLQGLVQNVVDDLRHRSVQIAMGDHRHAAHEGRGDHVLLEPPNLLEVGKIAF